ncbi:hypothetical protein BGZ83_005635 [Gryganskiella cystojenkinii]|nr:hypothetical protein BGZ83_005635 [Gryganskiella cystojenkinii]
MDTKIATWTVAGIRFEHEMIIQITQLSSSFTEEDDTLDEDQQMLRLPVSPEEKGSWSMTTLWSFLLPFLNKGKALVYRPKEAVSKASVLRKNAAGTLETHRVYGHKIDGLRENDNKERYRPDVVIKQICGRVESQEFTVSTMLVKPVSLGTSWTRQVSDTVANPFSVKPREQDLFADNMAASILGPTLNALQMTASKFATDQPPTARNRDLVFTWASLRAHISEHGQDSLKVAFTNAALLTLDEVTWLWDATYDAEQEPEHKKDETKQRVSTRQPLQQPS